MLVLSRRLGERIVLPELAISLEVVGLQRNAVRIGIEAPDSVRIVRQELLSRSSETAPQADAVSNSGKPVPGNSVPAQPVLAAKTAPSPRKGDSAEIEHALRGKLNVATLGLQTLQNQLAAGATLQAQATLQFLLQRLESCEATESNARASARPAPGSALIVEDNRDEAELLANTLRAQGYSVAYASDGLDALEYLKEHKTPELALVDMRMPRCDGPATLQAIRSNPAYAKMRVFAVSGSEREEFATRIGDLGIDGWFRKPLHPDLLIQTIQASVRAC